MSERQRAPILLLAADHRRSFERIVGLDPPVTPADHQRLCDLKVLVVEALADVRATRPELAGVGALLDDHYGSDALATAQRLAIPAAIAFERSGQDVLEFEHDDWLDRLDALAGIDGASAKVLIRHRVDAGAAANATQLDRLGAFSAACKQRGVTFLLELLTPFTADERERLPAERRELELRPRLIADAIDDIHAAGIETDIWKLEGIADDDACASIANRARAGGRDAVSVVVLGAGAPRATVERWLRAASAGGYDGFAVGRSIWADALVAVDRGSIDRAAAKGQIVANYLEFAETFRAA